jgi:hypothetical protein
LTKPALQYSVFLHLGQSITLFYLIQEAKIQNIYQINNTKLELLLLVVTLTGGFLSCNSEEKNDVLSENTQTSEYVLSDADAKKLISYFAGVLTKKSETFGIGERKNTRNYVISKENGDAEIIPVTNILSKREIQKVMHLSSATVEFKQYWPLLIVDHWQIRLKLRH